MKQRYKDFAFRADTLALIDYVNTIVDDYHAQGFTLSVRQIYYQLVARDLVPNTERSYKRVASIINDGRLAGMIDWDAIEDRGRDVILQTRWDSTGQILQAAAKGYHMDKWVGQDQRVFVIVEKAALQGVLEGVCRDWDVPLLAARGYPSVSVLRDMALEHLRGAKRQGQGLLILHLGDHDPSGIDMTRDLDDRLSMFAGHLDLQRIALTRDQIDDQQPPPNPAKTTDSRFASYRAEHGDESWELDALQPQYLVDLVTEHIMSVVDVHTWEQRENFVEEKRALLTKLAEENA